MTTSAIITVMSKAVRAAAKGLLRDFGEVDRLQISKKGVANFVTSADLRTEKLLIAELQRARPKFGILSEESGLIEGSDARTRFVIDPIDGTTNFIHALSYICIAVSLEKLDESGTWDTVAAVIYDPIHDELFHAEKGAGAFLNNYKIKVADGREDMMLATTAPRRWKDNYTEVFQAMERVTTHAAAAIRCTGAAALDLAYVAAGRLDGAWHHHLRWWDMSAGALLVREAGGLTTTLSGEQPHEGDASIVAAGKHLQPSLCKLVSGL